MRKDSTTEMSGKIIVNYLLPDTFLSPNAHSVKIKLKEKISIRYRFQKPDISFTGNKITVTWSRLYREEQDNDLYNRISEYVAGLIDGATI